MDYIKINNEQLNEIIIGNEGKKYTIQLRVEKEDGVLIYPLLEIKKEGTTYEPTPQITNLIKDFVHPIIVKFIHVVASTGCVCTFGKTSNIGKYVLIFIDDEDNMFTINEEHELALGHRGNEPISAHIDSMNMIEFLGFLSDAQTDRIDIVKTLLCLHEFIFVQHCYIDKCGGLDLKDEYIKKQILELIDEHIQQNDFDMNIHQISLGNLIDYLASVQ